MRNSSPALPAWSPRPGLVLHQSDELLQEIPGSDRALDVRFDPGTGTWLDPDGGEAVESLVHAVLDMLNGEGTPRRT